MAGHKIDINNISYNKGKFSLGPINFAIEQGTVTGIIGKNGSGKSTLLKLLHGDLKPIRGNVFLDGRNIVDFDTPSLSRKMSFLSQEMYDPFKFTVRNVMEVAGYTREQDSDSYLLALEELRIASLVDLEFSNLSGGEKRLVTIAASLYQNAEVLIMDEPTTFLDIDNQLVVHNALKRMKKSGKTLVVVMHELNVIHYLCDNVIILRGGKVVDSGKVNEVMRKENLEIAYDLPFEEIETDTRKLFVHRF